jgi:hypothetical protein
VGISQGINSQLVKLAQGLSSIGVFVNRLAIPQQHFDLASQIYLELLTANEQYANWMIGIKRLIDMARALA